MPLRITAAITLAANTSRNFMTLAVVTVASNIIIMITPHNNTLLFILSYVKRGQKCLERLELAMISGVLAHKIVMIRETDRRSIFFLWRMRRIFFLFKRNNINTSEEGYK